MLTSHEAWFLTHILLPNLTSTGLQMTPDQIEFQILSLKNDNQRLLELYGKGVRPGWVSADLALNDLLIEQWYTELRRIQTQQGT